MNPISWWWTLIGGQARYVRRIVVWTLALAVVGGLFGGWQALRTPPQYRVEATLAVYPTHFRWISDSHVQTLQRPRNDARNMAMVMAKGPNVLNAVIRELGDTLPEEWRDWQRLRRHLVVRGGEGVYVYLAVIGQDKDLVYQVAHTWAKATEAEVERTFYRYDSDIPALREQMESLRASLDQAERALEAFRTRTGLGLVDESRVAVVVSDYQGLRPGLGGFNATVLELGTVNGTLATYRHAQHVLRDLADQVRAAKGEHRSLQTVPLELVDTLEPVQKRGYISYERLKALGEDYDAVIRLLNQEAENLQPAIDSLQQRSTHLQSTLSSQITQLRQLIRQRRAVETLYNALLAKENELKAEAAVASNYVDVVEVREPRVVGRLSILLHVLAGSIVGGFLGFALGTTVCALRKGREGAAA